MPDWWPAMVAASHHPERIELFGEAAWGHSETEPTAREADLADLHLSGLHWLEFDQFCDNSYALVGLFQHCSAKRPREERTWNQVIDHFHNVGCFLDGEHRRSKALRLVFDTFGVPIEWGLMVGRTEGLKVVAQLADVTALQLQTFFQRADLQATLGGPSNTTKWCKLAASAPRGLGFALSLDLNLSEDRIAPTLGLEISGLGLRSGMTRAADAWATLEILLKEFGVPTVARTSLSRVIEPLPKGQREQLDYGELGEFLANELKQLLRIAFHNHVKLVFAPELPVTLKSYVMLRLLKGNGNA